MSTDTLEKIDLDIDWDSPVHCQDTQHKGDNPAVWVTTHSDECSYVICGPCAEQDMITITRWDEVSCQCDPEIYFPSDWVRFIPL